MDKNANFFEEKKTVYKTALEIEKKNRRGD